jgi:integration host factor subunit alpha
MTKEDIIKAIWNELPNLKVSEARCIYETTIKVIKDRLSKGEDIELRGFGNFVTRGKGPRIGRNPRTGDEAEICKRRVVTFRPSKIFREIANNNQKNR